MTNQAAREPSGGLADVFVHQSFGQPLGFGKSPALMLIDFTVGFCDPDVFGGGNIRQAVGNAADLLVHCRAINVPVVHTKIIYAEDGSDANLHTIKVPRLLELTESNPASEFAPEVLPIPGEIVIRKRLPSAFFGTDLAGVLNGRGIDTIVLAGCTTSGCVRASALDGVCIGFRPILVRECVGDRHLGAHEASLFDLGKKYADVMSLDQVLAALSEQAAARPGGEQA